MTPSQLNLVQRYTDGIATPEESLRLEQELLSDAELRGLFLRYVNIDVGLSDSASLVNHVDAMNVLRQSRAKFTASKLRSFKAAAACLTLVVFTMIWTVFGPTSERAWATVAETHAGVQIVSGKQTRLAKQGDFLRSQEHILVPNDSTARLNLMGFGSAELGPNTNLGRTTDENVLDLSFGFVSIRVNNKRVRNQSLRVRTPQAEAEVTGTRFNLAATSRRTALRVSEGRVHLTNLVSGRVEDISRGSGTIASDEIPMVVKKSRPGSALLIASRIPLDNDWDRFNQLIGDKLVNSRLWNLGFQVEVRHYDEVQLDDLKDRSLVIVSLFDFGVGEDALERIQIATKNVPVLCLEPAAYPVLGMTDSMKELGFGFEPGESAIEFFPIEHSLSAGLSGIKEAFFKRCIGWGRPENGATSISSLPEQPSKVTLFAYETGQMMREARAPSRRVGLFLDPFALDEQSEAWSLFEAAVDWCVATEEKP